jgi:hypothetical protein
MSGTQGPATRPNRVVTEGVADVARDPAQPIAAEVRNTGRKMGGTARDDVADSAVRSADAAADATHCVARLSHEAALAGLRVAARLHGRYADLGYDRGQRTLAELRAAMDAYRQAGEQTAEHVQALFSSYLAIGRAMQQLQHACIDQLDRGIQQATRRPQDLLHVGSIREFAETQRDLYCDAIRYAVDSAAPPLSLAGRATQEATLPLQGHAERGT